MAGYIEANRDQVDEQGHRLVVRNGSHQAREVTTAGAVPVKQPRVNDKRIDEEYVPEPARGRGIRRRVQRPALGCRP